MLRKLLSNKHLTKPYKLFFLGAGKNNKLSGHCLLLLLCVRILLLPTLLLLLLLLYLVDFSQKIWYNHGIVGGAKATPKIDFIFVDKFIFIKMDNYENAMQYINEQETTNISYVKIGNNSKNLIVSFAGNGPAEKDFFQRKTSLMELKYERNDFDILYLRNQRGWYLGGLKGIGKNINCTIAFLKREFAKYDKVVCVGNSAGGYASLLFGSLLKVNEVIIVNGQTDLQYVKNKLNHPNLIKRSKECPATWSKYNKIVNVLNENVLYNVFYKGDENCVKNSDLALHGDYHYDQIKHCLSVSKFYSRDGWIPLIEKFLDE